MRSNLAHSGSVLQAYRLLASLAYRLPYPPGTLASSVAGRRGAAARWEAWAATHRTQHPLVWAHAASVGEQQVLEPVLERLRRSRPALQIVLTHTSPSVPPTPVPAAVCHRDYLPWDEPTALCRALDALCPALLVFGRGDLWPLLVREAATRRIPVAVVGGTVRPRSARLRFMTRRAFRPVYRTVARLGAVRPEDAERWARLGVPPDRITVTGDPRHDRIVERIPSLVAARAVGGWAGQAPVLAAGSIDPSDDAPLIDALRRVRERTPSLRALLVPHEISDQRIRALARGATRAGLATDVWSGPPAPLSHAPTVIVRARGLLADLYLSATAAYVGGGFRTGRLHAVVEPAAVGLPVMVGPRWRDAVDAPAMVAAGGVVPVGTGDELAEAVTTLIADPAERARRGLAARAALTVGASRLSVEGLLGLLPR